MLITGESGVGKELLAKAIHRLSRRQGKFVSENIAGLDDTLFTDTLFGHAQGAYTDARNARKGLVEEAAGGTLFLDEIGDLSIGSQVKLLRLIDGKEYRPLGVDQARFSEARFIIATNVNLEKKLEEGKFRRDLYFRLTHRIHLPPLRERLDDLSLLVDHFLRQAAQDRRRRDARLAPGAPAGPGILRLPRQHPGAEEHAGQCLEWRQGQAPVPVLLPGVRPEGFQPAISIRTCSFASPGNSPRSRRWSRPRSRKL